jgi:uroporphyrinogen-III decarboxylase
MAAPGKTRTPAARTGEKVFPSDRMTSRERLLAAYRGEAVDRLPFWAKVTNATWRLSQPEAVRAWSARELLDHLHADGLFGSPRALRCVAPHVHTERSRQGTLETRITQTPDGDLVETWAMDPLTESWHPREFAVKTREDLGRFRWLYTDVRFETDEEALGRARAEKEDIGDRGITLVSWGTSPLMHLVEHVIGPVETTYFLADWADEMDELIARMHAANLEGVRRLAEETCADVVVSVENTSTTLISPAQFERYCFRHLCDYGRAIEAAGKRHELHMCGHLKALLPRIDCIPAASIEAYTSPTLGNARLADGRQLAPSKTLVGGTNVNIWLRPVEEIQRYILGELEACPDHRRIVLTTAGVAPPACRAETFRAVGEWLATVPVRM